MLFRSVWAAPGSRTFNTLWRRLFEFGYASDDVEVLTFWEPGVPKVVKKNDKDARITVYRRKDKPHAVIAVCDMGNKKRQVGVDISGLGYGNPVVTNFENGKNFTVSPEGVIKVELPRREFVLIEIRGR